MTWLFTAAILLSSCLLFLVQPMCAKMLLPYLGGTPAVWNTCMVFFQAGLLLGYAYAHFAPRWLGIGPHAILHLIALVLTYFLLPIGFPEEMPEDRHPVLWLLAMLTVRVGLPFTLIAASGPLLQRWFVCKTSNAPRDPYFLYAASNLGSFLALALFPLGLEPYLPLPAMSEVWQFGFLALTALIAFCAPLRMPRLAIAESNAANASPPPSGWNRARWIVLAMIPSSLLLSVTTYATTDVAAVPLLWVIPLGIYLVSFILVFASRPPIPHALLTRWLPLVVLVLSLVMLTEASDPMPLVLGLHLFGLFWLTMVCHGELARTRPAPEHLTEFYLYLALGGMLGGVLDALIAPLLFSGLFEYPLMIVLACFFGLENAARPTRTDLLWAGRLGLLTAALVLAVQSQWFVQAAPGTASVALMFGVPLILCYLASPRPARFTLSLGAVLLASGLYHGIHGTAACRERSFFGIHRVTVVNGLHRLVHGNTIHGQQNPDSPRTPLAYYSNAGPIGDVFAAYKGDPRLKHVGVVGLGTGTLAAYSEKGEDWTFFEIDPSVKHLAEHSFTFLRQAQGKVHIDLGDARLQLRKSPQQFGLLIVDAFGSDAIPVHLLTREALQVYLDHLQPDGILAFHVSNRYVDLEPVLAALAKSENPPLECRIREDRSLSIESTAQGILPSVWIVLARNSEALQPLLRKPSWRQARTKANVKAWTDRSSNLLQVFRWKTSD